MNLDEKNKFWYILSESAGFLSAVAGIFSGRSVVLILVERKDGKKDE